MDLRNVGSRRRAMKSGQCPGGRERKAASAPGGHRAPRDTDIARRADMASRAARYVPQAIAPSRPRPPPLRAIVAASASACPVRRALAAAPARAGPTVPSHQSGPSLRRSIGSRHGRIMAASAFDSGGRRRPLPKAGTRGGCHDWEVVGASEGW